MSIRGIDAERVVMLNACEDYALLWQICGEIRDLWPDEGEESALQAARLAARALLQRGLLDVYRRESRGSAFVRLDSPEREAALDCDAYWRADAEDAVEVGVAATAAGESAYQVGDDSKPR